jgi:hypothetical protein
MDVKQNHNGNGHTAALDRSGWEDTEAFTEAFREAVTAACMWHKRIGNPIASWENGQVVWIQPEDIHPPDRAIK